jgi:hypothetical protein
VAALIGREAGEALARHLARATRLVLPRSAAARAALAACVVAFAAGAAPAAEPGQEQVDAWREHLAQEQYDELRKGRDEALKASAARGGASATWEVGWDGRGRVAKRLGDDEDFALSDGAGKKVAMLRGRPAAVVAVPLPGGGVAWSWPMTLEEAEAAVADHVYGAGTSVAAPDERVFAAVRAARASGARAALFGPDGAVRAGRRGGRRPVDCPEALTALFLVNSRAGW